MARCTATAKGTGEQCKRQAHPGASVCVKHGAAAPHVKAAARKRLDRVEAEREVERFRGRLGLEAPDEPLEVTALREIRRARGDLSAWQAAVDELTAVGGLEALGVHSGNEKKPNEVEKHFVLARRDEERDRLMGWIATARKLGIEEARLEHEQRLAEAEAERLVTVIRVTLDASKVSLLEAGAPADVVEVWFRERVPTIVRTAIEATHELVADGGAAQ